MDPKAYLWREIVRTEAQLADPRCPNRKAKKAWLERCRQKYREAGTGASVYELGQDDYERGDPCPLHIPERAAGWRNAAGNALLNRPTDTGYPRTYGDWHPGDEM